MPRTAAKITQADIARAIRAMMQAHGSAQVVFDRDGSVRVTPIAFAAEAARAAGTAGAAGGAGAAVDEAEDFDL